MKEYTDKCGSCIYFAESKCEKVSGALSVFPSKPKCRLYVKDAVVRKPDYRVVKKCSECEHVNAKGWCSFYTLHAYLRGECIIDRKGLKPI